MLYPGEVRWTEKIRERFDGIYEIIEEGTHEHQLVRDFKRRVIMLEQGRIVADNANGGLR